MAVGSPGVSNTKRYLVRAVRPDGNREIPADTALLSEALAGFPTRLLGDLTRRPHDSVEAATGRVVYPAPRTREPANHETRRSNVTEKRTKAASERREAERRTKVARAVELLEEGVSGIIESGAFEDYLRFMAAFHRYSPNNSLLIYLQRPDATRVAGYKRWQELGRQVRRDEEGLRIFAPRFRKVERDDGEGSGAEGQAGEAGGAREDGEKARILSGFKVVKVFALEQTDPIPGAPPLPEAPTPGAVDSGSAGEAEAAARLEAGLGRLLAAERVRVLEEDLDGRYGQYDRRKKKITLDRGMPPVERASTLCHEAIHHLLHAERRPEDKRATLEVEAEGAAFAVFSYFGLDTSAFSFAYVANFAGRTEALGAALKNVRAVAHRIISSVEEGEPGAGRAVRAGGRERSAAA